MNYRQFSAAIFLGFIFNCYATTVQQSEWRLNSEEAIKSGVEVTSHKSSLVCRGANDVMIRVPEIYRNAKYFGSELAVVKNGELQISVNLIKHEAEETIYDEKPFFGVSFCLNTSLMPYAEVYISYAKGQHITDTIVLNGLSKYVQ